MGDNIYADNKFPIRLAGDARTVGPWKNAPRFRHIGEALMATRYAEMRAQPGYAALRRQAKVIGTWDDHDYGLDNAGKEFVLKRESQRLMLDFFDEPPNSPRCAQEGVYSAYTYGPLGKRIKIILLDLRYFRDPVGSDGTMLGEAQWAWLSRQLTGSDAQIHLIGSSIQARRSAEIKC
eukprot:SM000159S01801  [mRNA]  locus=s159:219543:220284:- [translate_table: standard]